MSMTPFPELCCSRRYCLFLKFFLVSFFFGGGWGWGVGGPSQRKCAVGHDITILTMIPVLLTLIIFLPPFSWYFNFHRLFLSQG